MAIIVRKIYQAIEKVIDAAWRHTFRSLFQADLDRLKAYQATEAYQKAMRKRALWTDP